MSDKTIKYQLRILMCKKDIQIGTLFIIPENKIISSSFYYEFERKRLKKIRKRVREIDRHVNKIRVWTSTLLYCSEV